MRTPELVTDEQHGVKGQGIQWGPLLAAVLAASLSGRWVPAWIQMWLITAAVFFGFKWLTLAHWWLHHQRPGTLRALGYLLTWPGMDAESFFGSQQSHEERHERSLWIQALANTAFGALLFWLVARWVASVSLIAAGYVGIVGLGFLLNFGTLQLLTLAWRRLGHCAEPIMRHPLRARSLSDFWGRRWNMAFRDLAHLLIFQPLAGRWGPAVAMLLVFVISGLLHDLALSWPAGGGYGLPTLYFLVQAAGMQLERSRWGRRRGLGRGLPGRTYAAIVVLAPVALLFHLPAVRQIALPTMRALGAL